MIDSEVAPTAPFDPDPPSEHALPDHTLPAYTQPEHIQPAHPAPPEHCPVRGALYAVTPGEVVVVPAAYVNWGAARQRAFLAQRRLCAAESDLVAAAYEWVLLAREADPVRDPWESAAAEVSATLGYSRAAASRLVATAVELTERLPRTRELLRAGWIGLSAAHLVADATAMVDEPLVATVDEEIVTRLEPTRRRTHAPRLGPLRKMLGKVVAAADPVAAAARAREARRETGVWSTPTGDDVAQVTAVLRAEDAVELMERIEHLVRGAPDGDPRTLDELRAAGLLALSRGWSSLPGPGGAAAGGGEERATARRVVLHVYEDAAGEASLAGHGPLTWSTRDELRIEGVRRITDVGELSDPSRPGATMYLPDTRLRLFCRGRDGTCAFPGCRIEAERCDLDHIEPFDHASPASGGRTTSGNLACLCRFHHRMKTEGLWVYHRTGDGGYEWRHGPRHPHRDPGFRAVVEPTGPLAGYARPRESGIGGAQWSAGERAGAGAARPREHLADRRASERRRARREVTGAGAGEHTLESVGSGAERPGRNAAG